MKQIKKDVVPQRPTSPHLTIYRKQISSVLSIFHRATGIILFGGLSIIAWWFIFFVFSGYKPCYLKLATNWVCIAALIVISLSMFYHLCTGVRHLIWDTGKCLSVKAMTITGYLAIITAFILTTLFWLMLI